MYVGVCVIDRVLVGVFDVPLLGVTLCVGVCVLVGVWVGVCVWVTFRVLVFV